ncbi:helix-turn-helix domain-containing protein [Lacticaseibacillus porcinae]|uniref:helix-turn-helix domain-containing protein n=1 Tax=Lacticaseibacillus porcinae TaxID=1123687 RepID=UPI000F77BC88|nr:helix-turn-helix transcriptional regulator [Lacticaseibacillus porcinae]
MERKLSNANPIRIKLGHKLSQVIERQGLTQKYLAHMTGRSNATINNYTNDYPASPNDAVNIANIADDTQFSEDLGHMMLGLLKSFSGPRMPRSNLSALLDVDEFEERQEKQARDSGNIRLLIGNPEGLTTADRAALREYLNQKLDSTLVDMTLLGAGADKLGITLMELFDDRMPAYIKNHYMEAGEPKWQRKRG